MSEITLEIEPFLRPDMQEILSPKISVCVMHSSEPDTEKRSSSSTAPFTEAFARRHLRYAATVD